MLLYLLPLVSYAWDYKQKGADWSGTCDTGKTQTPINIVRSSASMQNNNEDTYSIEFDFKTVKTSAKTGFGSYQISGGFGDMSFVKGDLKILNTTLANAHFHSPSENTLDDEYYDLEMHIVMEDKAKLYSYVVFGVFFKVDGNNANEFLDQAINAKNAELSISLSNAIDSNIVDDFFVFSGSLTTPPCTEKAFWIIDNNIRSMSTAQYDFFNSMWAGNSSFSAGNGNNREVQNLNGRVITHYMSFASIFKVTATLVAFYLF